MPQARKKGRSCSRWDGIVIVGHGFYERGEVGFPAFGIDLGVVENFSSSG